MSSEIFVCHGELLKRILIRNYSWPSDVLGTDQDLHCFWSFKLRNVRLKGVSYPLNQSYLIDNNLIISSSKSLSRIHRQVKSSSFYNLLVVICNKNTFLKLTKVMEKPTI